MAAIDLPVNDPYTSILYQRQPRSPSASSDRAAAANASSATNMSLPRSATAPSLAADEEPPPPSSLTADDLIHTTPPAVVRLLAYSAPAIHLGVKFVRVITWTSGSHADGYLLLLAWWFICLGGYETVRYGANLAGIGYIGYNWVKKSRKIDSSGKRRGESHQSSPASVPVIDDAGPVAVVDEAKLSATIDESLLLCDFLSHLLSRLLRPLHALFDWSDPASTRATLVFLLFTYPIFLFLTLFFVPLRFLFLPLGSLAIVWHAPWFALLRRALWKSAAVRRSTRAVVGVLSGQRRPRELFGRRRDVLVHGANHSPKRSWWRRILRRGGKAPTAVHRAASGDKEKDSEKEDGVEVERIEDVVFQFTIFENQRWWVGLDWTAALLPQERPSWSDDQHHPVSPPSSFSLPPPRTTLHHTPSASDSDLYTRRFIKWQWIDPEWTVASAGFISSSGYQPPVASAAPSSPGHGGAGSGSGTGVGGGGPGGGGESRRDRIEKGLQDAFAKFGGAANKAPPAGDRARTTSLSSISGGAGGGMPATPSSPSASFSSTLFSSGAGVNTAAAVTDVSPPSSPTYASTGSGGAEDPEDVDVEGWQYGDNVWEKMSSKAGLGRYTRRRRWIRRAVLVEVVERGLVMSKEEAEKEKAKLEGGGGGGAEMTLPSNEEAPPTEDTESTTTTTTAAGPGKAVGAAAEVAEVRAEGDMTTVLSAAAGDEEGGVGTARADKAGGSDLRQRLARAASRK